MLRYPVGVRTRRLVRLRVWSWGTEVCTGHQILCWRLGQSLALQRFLGMPIFLSAQFHRQPCRRSAVLFIQVSLRLEREQCLQRQSPLRF
jgi:hypothetical protein